MFDIKMAIQENYYVDMIKRWFINSPYINVYEL